MTMPYPRLPGLLPLLLLLGALGAAEVAPPSPLPVAEAKPAIAPKPSAGSAAAGELTPADVADIHFDQLPSDGGVVVPYARGLLSADDAPELVQPRQVFEQAFAEWPPAADPDPAKRIGALLSLAALADLSQMPIEGEVPIMMLSHLRDAYPRDQLARVLAGFARDPSSIPLVTEAPTFGFAGHPDEVRDRASAYAAKMLGRLLGLLPR